MSFDLSVDAILGSEKASTLATPGGGLRAVGPAVAGGQFRMATREPTGAPAAFDGPRSAAEAVRHFPGLNFEVLEKPVFDENGARLEDFKRVVHSGTGEILAIHPATRPVIQNADALSPFDELVAMGAARYIGGGTFNGGHSVWGQVELTMRQEIVPNHEAGTRIAIREHHDGGGSYSCSQTTIVIVCKNTLAMAFKKGAALFKIRHTRLAADRAKNAKAALDEFVSAAQKEFDAYRDLAKRQAVTKDIMDYLLAVVPNPTDPERKQARRNAEETRDDIMRYLESGEGQNLPGVRGTYWGALNAVTGYVDNVKSREMGEEERVYFTQYGAGADLKTLAYKTAVEMAAKSTRLA